MVEASEPAAPEAGDDEDSIEAGSKVLSKKEKERLKKEKEKASLNILETPKLTFI